MDNLQIFKNEEFGTVRTVMINGEPWFVGKDVAEALGYKNTRVALQDNVTSKHKGVTKVTTFGGEQDMVIIDEPGLYSLVFGSNLPSATKFQDWVYEEVLPAIRKTGSYNLQARDSYMIEDPIERANRWIAEQQAHHEEVKALESQVAVQSQQIAELQPKASYYDLVLSSPNLLSVSEIAKDYGWSATKMNKFLNNLGIQYKLGNNWLLYQKYAELGYTSTKTHAHPAPDGSIHTSVHTYWTQKGRLFIYDLLKRHGIFPIMELRNYDLGGAES